MSDELAVPTQPQQSRLGTCCEAYAQMVCTCVIASASSNMSSLYGGHGKSGSGLPIELDAKVLILLRTTLMPRSSDALSSITRAENSLGLYARTLSCNKP